MSETIIIILLIWIAFWQFINTKTMCENQGFIIKKIDELKNKKP